MDKLTCLQVDFLANHIVSPGSAEARMMTVTSGRKCSALYAKHSRVGCLVRMCLESSAWHSTRCSLIWKARGMKSKRFLFQLAASTPRTDGIASGLWPTPNTKDATIGATMADSPIKMTGGLPCRMSGGKDGYALTLGRIVQLFPTPRANKPEGYSSEEFRPTLAQVVTGQDKPQHGRLNPLFVEWLMGYPENYTALTD